MESVQEKKRSKKHPRLNRQARKPAGIVRQAGTGAPSESVAPPLTGPWHDALIYGIYPAILLLTLAVLTIRPVMEPDTWFHMALGRYILDNGEIPKADIFSYNAFGNEWISSGWISSVLLQLAYSAAGTLGLSLLVFTVTAFTYLTVYFRSIAAGLGRGSMTVLLLVAAATAYLRFTPRPEIFSQLFLVGTLLLLSSAGSAYAKGAGVKWKRLWLLPVLITAWANFHAGFFVIFPVLLLFAFHQHFLSKPPRHLFHLWAPIGLAMVAGIANPYGWRIVTLPWKIKRMPGVAEHVYEWVPIFSQTHASLPAMANAAYVVLVTFGLLALVTSYRRMPWWQIAVLLVLLALPLYERRHLALAALAVPAALYPYLGWFDTMLTRTRAVLPALAVAGAALLIGLMSAGRLGVGQGLLQTAISREQLPYHATRFMSEHPPPAKLYNSYGPGGYLLYHLSPDTKVFIDGRLDVYDPKTWQDYLAADSGALTVEELVQNYDVKTMLIYTRGMGADRNHLAVRAGNTPGWHLVHFDDSYVLYVCETEDNKPYIARHGYKYVTPFNLNKMEEMKGLAHTGEIESELKRALRLSDGSAKAHLAYAVYARNEGREQEYRHHMEQAQQKNPAIRLGQ